MYANALKLLLFFRPQHTLYDIDDADYIRRPAQTMHYFMKKCSACAAGSQSLVEYVKQFNPNTFLLTSPVIDHGYTKEDLAETYTVGWVGYYGAHRQSLMQLFFPALQEINFPLKLTLLGVANREEEQEIANYFKHNKNISVESPLHLDWHNEEAIYERITRFDVGVSPLLDTEFNRAKSAFKLKQCLSCGVPVLGSSVGENKAFLQHGTNGYLCDSPEEFFHQLTSLKHTEHKHYRQLSQYAKESFPAFSLEHYCAELIKIFR